MLVANPPNASTMGCGTPTFAPTAGSNLLSFSNGTVGPNSVCIIRVNVTVPVVGTYPNTSGHLFIGDVDTGNYASDTLTVNDAPLPPPAACNWPMASWTMDPSQGLTTPPAAFYISPLVPSATAESAVITTAISNAQGQPINSWSASNWAATYDATRYFRFNVDTRNFTDVQMTLGAARETGASPDNVIVYYSQDGGTTYLSNGTLNLASNNTWYTYNGNFTGKTSTTGITYFRVHAYGGQASKFMYIDNIIFTGCHTPPPPTPLQSFSPDPIAAGSTSTLTFTISNPNGIPFTNVRFTDTLPVGLTVASGSTSQCGGTLTATAPRNLSFTGGTLAAGASCNITVTVTATQAGIFDNVTGYISADYTTTGTSTGTITRVCMQTKL